MHGTINTLSVAVLHDVRKEEQSILVNLGEKIKGSFCLHRIFSLLCLKRKSSNSFSVMSGHFPA